MHAQLFFWKWRFFCPAMVQSPSCFFEVGFDRFYFRKWREMHFCGFLKNVKKKWSNGYNKNKIIDDHISFCKIRISIYFEEKTGGNCRDVVWWLKNAFFYFWWDTTKINFFFRHFDRKIFEIVMQKWARYNFFDIYMKNYGEFWHFFFQNPFNS